MGEMDFYPALHDELRGQEFAENFVQCILDALSKLPSRDVGSEGLREDFFDFLLNLPTEPHLGLDAKGTDGASYQ